MASTERAETGEELSSILSARQRELRNALLGTGPFQDEKRRLDKAWERPDARLWTVPRSHP